MTLAGMPPPALEEWATSLGACVYRLGRTLSELQLQLHKHRHSKRADDVQEQLRRTVQRCEAIRAEYAELDAAACRQLKDGERERSDTLAAMADAVCVKPVRRARLWTRALMAALAGVRHEMVALSEAMADCNLSAHTLAAAAQAVCAHACRIVGCDEATLCVSTSQAVLSTRAVASEDADQLTGQPAVGASKEPRLYRLRSTRASASELSACKLRVHGAEAREVSRASLGGICLTAMEGDLVVAPTGASDSRFSDDADGSTSGARVESLAYINLSDRRGALRVALRVANVAGGTHDGGAASRKLARQHLADTARAATLPAVEPPSSAISEAQLDKLRELGPLFSLALRASICRESSVGSSASRRAAATSSLAELLAELPYVLDDAPEHSDGGKLGALVRAFSSMIARLTDAEACTIYLRRAAIAGGGVENGPSGPTATSLRPAASTSSDAMVGFPSALDVDTGMVCAPTHVPLGGKERVGIAGTCLLTERQVIRLHGRVADDRRFVAKIDGVLNGQWTPVTALLCAPIGSAGSPAELIGVCNLVNKLAEPYDFDEADEAILHAVLPALSHAISCLQRSQEVERIKSAASERKHHEDNNDSSSQCTSQSDEALLDGDGD